MIRRMILVAAALLISTAAHAQTGSVPVLSPKAPPDRVGVVKKGDEIAFDQMIQPYVDSARATYPAAKARFLAGQLPPRSPFFVVTRLRDGEGRYEQVFIAVRAIENGRIDGAISSQVGLVAGYRHGQAYSFPETDVLDWVISRPDGSEEGNFVGKFLERQSGAKP